MIQNIRKARSVAARQWYRTVGALAVAGASLVPSVAHADATAQPTALGTYGPAGSDYLAAAQGFAGNIGGILSAILTLLMVIMAVWKGPALYKKVVNRFAGV